jgi:hypothetical protein
MKVKFIVLMAIALSLAGCLKAPETIKDISDLRQDHLAYWPGQEKNKELTTAETQIRADEDFNTIYFSVWHQSEPFYARNGAVNPDFKKFGMNLGFGENKRKHTKAWLKKLQQNAALDNYPNVRYPAITIRNSNLRALPTLQPHFSSPDGDANGWPFDNLQRSSVAVNTPIFVCHLSADKAWALVETCFTFGWMPVEDFSRVDKEFIKTWESGRYVAITRDQTTILDDNSNFGLKSSLGNIFPLVRENPANMEILMAKAGGSNGNTAVISHGYVPREAAVIKPLRLTSSNVVKIANELIGEPYGWGGLYGNRDCSSMTRDFFAPFGIWLPRHSEDQVKEAGHYIDLNGIPSLQKEKMIIEKGIPYLTLLWRKGHVMLYIGEQNGRALIFHNIWGIRTVDLRGQEGRKIIGQAAITTLRPGAELRNFDAEAGDLLTNIVGMSILVAE